MDLARALYDYESDDATVDGRKMTAPARSGHGSDEETVDGRISYPGPMRKPVAPLFSTQPESATQDGRTLSTVRKQQSVPIGSRCTVWLNESKMADPSSAKESGSVSVAAPPLDGRRAAPKSPGVLSQDRQGMVLPDRKKDKTLETIPGAHSE